MGKYKFRILDGIYDDYIADVEIELSDEQVKKIRTWIEDNYDEEDSFDICELSNADESFASELEDIAFEYAKNDSLQTALSEIGEDQDNGLSMFLNDVKNGDFIPENWDSEKSFTVKEAVKRDEYFEEWEDCQPKFGDPRYWEYIDERYNLYSLIDVDMIPYSVQFPDELYGMTAYHAN